MMKAARTCCERAHHRHEAAEVGEVSSDVSLANLTARQRPQGKHQQAGSVVYSQLNTNRAACLPAAAAAAGFNSGVGN